MRWVIGTPEEWSADQFGQVKLGDERRTERAVRVAARMMSKPSGSIPEQMGSWAASKALYRLLDEADVTHERLMEQHWAKTRELAQAEPVVLLIQDTTQGDYTGRKVAGMGPIGDGRGQGFLLHSTLAVRPDPREVLGVLYQQPFLRQPRPDPTESSYQRARRRRESDVWQQSVEAMGRAPEGAFWIEVGDRGSDIFGFLATCRAHNHHFLVRASQDRCIRVEDQDEVSHLLTWARTLPSQGQQVVEATDAQGRAREAQVSIAYGAVTLQPPFHSRQQAPQAAWVIRVWEATPPPDIAAPLEWVLVTSLPTHTLADAQRAISYYETRPVIEDYHQCLKTGCALETRQLHDVQRLFRLLGFLGVMAVQLLHLRDVARLDPQQLARRVLPADLVQVVAALAGVDPASLTLSQFWLHIAKQGGFLARRHDGPPGWKSLWKGWLHVQTLLHGVRLASRLPPP